MSFLELEKKHNIQIQVWTINYLLSSGCFGMGKYQQDVDVKVFNNKEDIYIFQWNIEWYLWSDGRISMFTSGLPSVKTVMVVRMSDT